MLYRSPGAHERTIMALDWVSTQTCINPTHPRARDIDRAAPAQTLAGKQSAPAVTPHHQRAGGGARKV